MKQELIELAIKHKFIPKNLSISWKEDYYLWMCELQQWLREVHNIYVVCNLFITDLEQKGADYYLFCYDLNNKSVIEDFIDNFVSYEEALETGLLEALKLIKQ